MPTRRRQLPRGWYPEAPEDLRRLARSWSAGARAGAVAAIAPHAGWTFSGRLAALSVASLVPAAGAGQAAVSRAADALQAAPLARTAAPITLAIFGGHLASGSRPLAARETAYDTPLGSLPADLDLLAELESALGLGTDEETDNTVEVLLPLAAVFLPGAKVLWLRSPNGAGAIELGEAVHAAAKKLQSALVCLGSTDLTHYGPNYGFSPKGGLPSAEAWVRGTNDKRFIDAALALDAPLALALGEAERSACSSGGAAAAIAFAKAAGASSSRLLDYATSLDVRRDDSFVGYAAIAFYKEFT